MAASKRPAKKKANPKKKTRKPRSNAVGPLKPHKIVGQLIGARHNAKGEVVDEEVLGPVAIFRPNFGRVRQLVDKAMADKRKAEKIARAAPSEE